jgi:hypothetical protein
MSPARPLIVVGSDGHVVSGLLKAKVEPSRSRPETETERTPPSTDAGLPRKDIASAVGIDSRLQSAALTTGGRQGVGILFIRSARGWHITYSVL